MNIVISKNVSLGLSTYIPASGGLKFSSCMKPSQVPGQNVDSYRADWYVNKVLEACAEYESKTCLSPVVACMGLASMPDGNDLRNSPAKYITSRIIALSRAEVLVVEPNLHAHTTFRLTSYEEAYNQANIIVWLVRHKQFLLAKEYKHIVELDFCGINQGGYYGFPV